MKQILNKILLFAVIALAITSCKTTKTITNQQPTGEKGNTEIPHGLTPTEMVMKVQKAQPAFHTANVKKMSLFVDVKGRQQNVKATCKMVTDSAIHLSVQPFFGVELFKLEITPGALVLIDKLNRKFYVSNYAIFKEQFGVTVNFNVIQAIISNRLFEANKTVLDPTDFKWKDEKSTDILMVQNENISQETVLDALINRISKVIIKTNDKAYNMQISYSGLKDFSGTTFPQNIFIDADNADSKALLHFTIEELEFDKPLTLEATNLARYNQGDIRTFFRK